MACVFRMASFVASVSFNFFSQSFSTQQPLAWTWRPKRKLKQVVTLSEYIKHWSWELEYKDAFQVFLQARGPPLQRKNDEVGLEEYMINCWRDFGVWICSTWYRTPGQQWWKGQKSKTCFGNPTANVLSRTTELNGYFDSSQDLDQAAFILSVGCVYRFYAFHVESSLGLRSSIPSTFRLQHSVFKVQQHVRQDFSGAKLAFTGWVV